MATKKSATGKTPKSATSRKASDSSGGGKKVTKATTSKPSKKPAKGILRKATEAVSDVISGVTKPAAAGLKAGTTVFLQEVAGSIGSKPAKSAGNGAIGPVAKPKTKAAPKKPATTRTSSAAKKTLAKKNK